MRRRSASAESTAAVRRDCSSVTWAASRSSSVGPSSRSASAHCVVAAPIVIHGATNTSPTSPTASASHRAGSDAAISKK